MIVQLWKLMFCLIGVLGMACAHKSYPLSDHYNGKQFFNPWQGGPIQKSWKDLWKWQRERPEIEEVEWIDDVRPARPRSTNGSGDVHLTMINHATFLIQYPDLTVLTDPFFSERASPVSWAGPKRKRAPGMALTDLPPIDVILVSHNHYDHMDLPALKELVRRHDPKIYVPLGNKALLEDLGSQKIHEMDWWDFVPLSLPYRLHLVPAQHWSSRTPWDRNQALWGGFVLERAHHRLYFAGDTGYGPHFREIRERLGSMHISLIPIGAYEPRWFMKEQHTNPPEALQAHLDVESQQSFGIHWGTLKLTDEGIERPAEELAESLAQAGLDPNSFVAARNGQSWTLSLQGKN
jgi:L-ascorbate metabolism protein UlaG (beta-lactamase superfamily)